MEVKDTEDLIIYFNRDITKGYHPKSRIIIGNMEIYLEKHFNWFNILIVRWLLGIKIENLGGKDGYKYVKEE